MKDITINKVRKMAFLLFYSINSTPLLPVFKPAKEFLSRLTLFVSVSVTRQQVVVSFRNVDIFIENTIFARKLN